jgi:ketosteroid isomerase-like protein
MEEHMQRYLKILPVLALAGPLALVAHEDHDSPSRTVDSFHQALAGGDREAVLRLLDPEVTVFESGGAELSRDEYASHHLGADMEFSAATTRKVVGQAEGETHDAAWVLTRSETSGTFRGKEIDLLGAESVLLRRGEHGWRIVHIHWSSRPRSRSHSTGDDVC